MLYELVMVPPSVYNATPQAAGAGTIASSPGVAYATVPGAAPQLQAVTGLPINKGLQLALTSPALPLHGTGGSGKIDTTSHHHIFVGDLAPEIESHQLKEAFSAFGVVTECKIIKDMHTQKPKGYGFVAYATREEAEDAMQKMNGQLLGTRTIRTNWAVRKPPQPPDQKPLNYDEVAQAASDSNCTVYVGGVTRGLCEELLRDAFRDFGEILEVRVFKEKGYAFVRFDTHDGAARAIVTMHGKDVGGFACKCSWGKESSDKETSSSLLTQYGYYAAPGQLAYQAAAYSAANQLGCLQQPLNYAAASYATAAAAAAAAAAATTPTFSAASSGLLSGSSSFSTAAQLAASQVFGSPTSAAASFQQQQQQQQLGH